MLSAEILPEYIQEIINLRSTKNPNSRFVRKIHVLLSYADTNPEKVDSIGLQWITDEEFKMHKKTLCQLLGLKINSLNKNLKYDGFTQTQMDKSGWTAWTRKGFNRRDVHPIDDTDNENIIKIQDPVYSTPLSIVESIRKADSILIGAADQSQKNETLSLAINIWNEVVDTIGIDSVRTEYLILKLAKRYVIPGQTFENSVSVIKSILAPINPTVITFIEFYKFYLAFGPEPTIMYKIRSLLDIAVNTKPWLYFGFSPEEIKKTTDNFGYFDTENEPNCLIIVWNGVVHKGYNLPDVSSDGNYIVGDGNVFKDWEKYISSLQIM